jgi:hypothetical protein
MTKFTAESKVRREITVAGIESGVQAEIAAAGISFWVKGSRKRIHIGWKQIIQAARTGTDVPSYLMDKPFELLEYQVKKGS